MKLAGVVGMIKGDLFYYLLSTVIGVESSLTVHDSSGHAKVPTHSRSRG